MRTRIGLSIVLLLCGLFSLSAAKIYFEEEFNSGWESKWTKTTWKADQQGTFEITRGMWHGPDDIAFGLQTKSPVKFHDISAKFPEPISIRNAPLVLQYSVKFEQVMDCGGGYIKAVGPEFDPTNFGGDTPLLIMFGPDICGSDNKVHVILDHKGKGYLWKKKPLAPNDKLTHIYTLALYPNETYSVFLDTHPIENGTIAADWEFAIPKEIPDPNDKKPEDFDDRMYIEDTTEKKPADWVDEEFIIDTDAPKPEDWDEVKEGKWTPPKTKNPKYKGPWQQKKIYNTNYKGIWKPKMIPNPQFTGTIIEPYTLGGIGIDVWQTKPGTIFDNIMIADSLDDAFAHAQKVLDNLVAKEKEFKVEDDKIEEAKAKEAREKMQEQMKMQEKMKAQEGMKDEKVGEKEDL